MPEKFSILVFDFHNTIYDEVMEYGLAIDEAIAVWEKAASSSGKPLDRGVLYQELSFVHKELGSDWDEDVWRQLPSLKNLGLGSAGFNEILVQAVTARQNKSKQLTLAGAYSNAVETLRGLKKNGVRLYMITEAAADAGMRGVSWLELDGIIDGVYTYPSRLPPLNFPGTRHGIFPESADNTGHLKKPNPLLLATVVLDDAKKAGSVPQSVDLKDVFDLMHDPSLALVDFPLSSPIQKDITATLILKNGAYKRALQQTLDAMLYVGDSKFKDGFLARNAGVKFGLAAYGKHIKPGEEGNFKKSLDMLYAVTGWDKDTLKLTHEADQSKAVQALQPDFIFENSLAEAQGLF